MLLKENRTILDNMSRVLVEKETIYTEEVKMLMAGAMVAEVLEAMEKREGEHEANPFGKMGEAPVEEGAETSSETESTEAVTETPVEETAEEATVETTEEAPTQETEATEEREEKTDEE